MHSFVVKGAQRAALVFVVASSLACSGGGGSGASGAEDVSLPVADTGASASEASLTDTTAAASQDDSGTPDDAGSLSCSAPDATSCETCCATAHASGFTAFGKLELACACVPTLCGPLEAGAADAGDPDGSGAADGSGDTGLFGEGVCASTCASASTPVGTCATCLKQTLGSVESEGVCLSTVAAQCLTDTTCAPFLDCVTSCP